jgi:hypothetical protein
VPGVVLAYSHSSLAGAKRGNNGPDFRTRLSDAV